MNVLKNTILISVIGLSLFTSCKDKKNDPQPTTSQLRTEDMIKTTKNIRYVYDNDTALSYIAKWSNKTLKCINVDIVKYSKDTVYMTVETVVSNGFSTEYDGHRVLRVTWKTQYAVYSQSIDYLAFKGNRFIQRIPDLNTHVNPWIINPLESNEFDLQILSDSTITFPSGDITIGSKGMRILN